MCTINGLNISCAFLKGKKITSISIIQLQNNDKQSTASLTIPISGNGKEINRFALEQYQKKTRLSDTKLCPAQHHRHIITEVPDSAALDSDEAVCFVYFT